ncbi:Site-specific DNA recombinase [Belliella buryatensis]|uniref:Site-specific DNA recombinase n=1 Tax=Belliella buryatensis TaxID=1500549 RepID=A0A239GNC6_9BACT|nr:recombinase family protein [Belliella buryatensis]SNS70776.1 Site-specific DNA recombinase [Belliella buryatensis]
MKNVITYSRVSTDEQAQQGYSLDYQEQTIRRFCELKEYNVIQSFREDHSAKDFNRPEWKKIIKLIKSKEKQKDKITAVVILRADRFSRNLLLSLMEKAKLTVLGCDVEFVEGGIDLTSPESLVVEAIQYALPQVENEKLSLRTKEGSYRCRLSGGWTGSPLRGYKPIRLEKYPSMAFNEQANLIREAFEKMASGLYSADQIRRWLNGKGMKITKNQFPNIIRNVAYTGKVVIMPFKDQPKKIVDGLHPPLVSEELFATANDVLDGKKRNMDFKSDKSELYPLKGYLRCSEHGRTLSAYGAKGRNDIYHYYVCTKNGCPRYPVPWTHDVIEKILEKIQFSAKTISDYKKVLVKKFESMDVDRKHKLRSLEKELEVLKGRKTFLQNEYLEGKIDASDYNELKSSVEVKLFQIDSELSNLRSQKTPFKDYLDNDIKLMEDLVGFYKKADGRTKKKILGLIFADKIEFDEDKNPTYQFTPPIKALIQISEDADKDNVSMGQLETFVKGSGDFKVLRT